MLRPTIPYAVMLPLLLWPTSAVFAQLYECDGRWTNKLCAEGQATKVLPETDRPVDLEAEANRKKNLLVSSLRMRSDKASRKHGVDLDITGIEESCKALATTYEQCMTLVQNAEDRLQERIDKAKLIAEQEKTNKLLERGAKDTAQVEQNQAVSVTQDNSVVVIEDHHRPHRRTEWEGRRDDRREPAPLRQPQESAPTKPPAVGGIGRVPAPAHLKDEKR